MKTTRNSIAEQEIKIAADSIESLRAIDVDRCLEWSPNRYNLARYILSLRPDLESAVRASLEALPARTRIALSIVFPGKGIGPKKTSWKGGIEAEEAEAEAAEEAE